MAAVAASSAAADKKKREKEADTLSTWIKSESRSTEHIVHNEIMEHKEFGARIALSSKRLRVYRNLKSIFYEHGSKHKHILAAQELFERPAVLVVDKVDPLEASKTLLESGQKTLTMCTTQDQVFAHRHNESRLNQEDNLFIRTSILYPLRSSKYKSLVHTFLNDENGQKVQRNTMSVFVPDVLLFRGNFKRTADGQRFPVFDWDACRYLSVALVPGAADTAGMDAEELRKVVQAKMNCVFDIALERKEEKFQSLVLTDLYCTTEPQIAAYVASAKALVDSYLHCFQTIVFAIDRNDALLEAVRKEFTPSSAAH